MRLVRLSEHRGAVGGVLLVNGYPLCMTLELPWQNNERNVSCVPCGRYNVRKKLSIKYGEVFELLEVPNRDGILIHVGNFVRDSQGCILVGQSFGMKGERLSVWQSKSAMAELRSARGDIDFIEIVDSAKL